MGPVETISIIISVAACFVGLAGWLSGRDKRIIGDEEWRGQINAKLDGWITRAVSFAAALLVLFCAALPFIGSAAAFSLLRPTHNKKITQKLLTDNNF